MHTRRIAQSLLAATLLSVSGCEDKPTQPSTYAISGHVQLVGQMTAGDGQPLGTRTVTDADGVGVDLLYGSTAVAHVLTSDGAFRFTGVAPGGYFVRANIFGSLFAKSNGLTVANRDVALVDPLVLQSVGDLYPIPNPMDTLSTILFESTDVGTATLRVLALDGTLVRQLYVTGMPSPSLYVTKWDGNDSHGTPAPPGSYWMTYAAGSDERAQLLFR